mmetsp:Transcript_8184/g.26876  ORF Transcript_8184/g.26876 Transcript_8184/m.26876 type:complete len:214 (+) Transcript_8184:895-1536(+)
MRGPGTGATASFMPRSRGTAFGSTPEERCSRRPPSPGGSTSAPSYDASAARKEMRSTSAGRAATPSQPVSLPSSQPRRRRRSARKRPLKTTPTRMRTKASTATRTRRTATTATTLRPSRRRRRLRTTARLTWSGGGGCTWTCSRPNSRPNSPNSRRRGACASSLKVQRPSGSRRRRLRRRTSTWPVPSASAATVRFSSLAGLSTICEKTSSAF